MKTFRLLCVAVFCGVIVSSCFTPPEYPDAPEIVFKSVDFIKGKPFDDGSLAADTVLLVLTFKDGNGDVGVSADDVYPPFNDRWYHTKSRLRHDNSLSDDCSQYDDMCWYINPLPSEFAKYVDLKDGRVTAGYDTLPGFAKPYNCLNWEVVYEADDNDPNTNPAPIDTVYFTLNPHYNNIFVEFQVRTDQGVDPYVPFDEKEFFTFPFCGVRTFHGRIPVLSEDLSHSTPLEGEIRYSIPSVSFQTIFGSQTLRLKVYIEDRALHQSNIVYTRDFTLNE
jgi:hypothetical protein